MTAFGRYLQNQHFTFEHEVVTIAAQIPVSGSTFPAILTGPAYPQGSGTRGAATLATGSSGVGSYVLTLQDAYPTCLYWDVKYESVNSVTDQLITRLQSNLPYTVTGTGVAGAQFKFALVSGSTVTAPSSGSFLNFTAFMKKSPVK